MIARNSDPVAVTLEVRQLEDLVFVLESFIADCGIPEDDDSEPLPAVLRTLREALDAVPLISFA